MNNKNPYTAQGSRIESARRNLGWNQTELAEKINEEIARLIRVGILNDRTVVRANQAQISRYEQGIRTPKGSVLMALSNVLKQDPAWLLALPPETAEDTTYHPQTVDGATAARLVDQLPLTERARALSLLRLLTTA